RPAVGGEDRVGRPARLVGAVLGLPVPVDGRVEAGEEPRVAGAHGGVRGGEGPDAAVTARPPRRPAREAGAGRGPPRPRGRGGRRAQAPSVRYGCPGFVPERRTP